MQIADFCELGARQIGLLQGDQSVQAFQRQIAGQHVFALRQQPLERQVAVAQRSALHVFVVVTQQARQQISRCTRIARDGAAHVGISVPA